MHPYIAKLPFNQNPVPVLLKSIPVETVQQALEKKLYEWSRPISFPSWWDWHWLSEDKERGYSGTFPKRVANYYYKQTGEKLPIELVSIIGEVHKRIVTPEGIKLLLDFDQTLEWRQGDFHDPSSCFWSDRKAARPSMRRAGGFAVRRWLEDKRYQEDTDEETEEGEETMPLVKNGCIGQGRCWAVPIGNHGVVLFNCYDKSFRLETYGLAVAEYLDLECRLISVVNNDRTDGKLYINSGSGMAVGASKWIENIERVDLKVEIINEE